MIALPCRNFLLDYSEISGITFLFAAPNWNRPNREIEGGSMNKRVFITTALAAAVATPLLLSAQKPVPAPSWKAEKCYGIAKAQKNDCASTGNNSCGGTSKLNSDPKAWIYVPEGYCERIVGGSKTPK
jgi:uncharacterized membrane protein